MSRSIAGALVLALLAADASGPAAAAGPATTPELSLPDREIQDRIR